MRTTRSRYLSSLTAVGISLVAATSLAQPTNTSTKPREGDFSVQRFEPAPGTKNFLSVEGVRMEGAMGLSVGVMFDYAHHPFVLQSCRSQGNCKDKNLLQQNDVHVIRSLFTWNLLAAISPVKILQIGLRVPFMYANGDGLTDAGTADPKLLKTGAVGDPTLELKLRVVGGAQDPFLLGFAAHVSGPLGHVTAKDKYLGSELPTGGLRAILDGQVGKFSIGANLGGVVQKPGRVGYTQIGPVQFRYGVGLGFQVSPIFRIVAETFGSTQFVAKNGTNTLEADGAFEIKPISIPISFRAGGGAGILKGVGVPAARAIFGVAFVREVGDQDGDGIADDKDKCPTVAEDKDNFEDDDGCFDDDNDGDKIPDDKDKCRDQPETVNGILDDDGCPDSIADKDKDGIPDDQDKCPDAGGKSVINRPGPNFGCPDTDKDGIADHLDKCPTEMEDTDGFEDTDGCPDPDNDHDGIPDDQDECIDQPEIINGFQDKDGCPDEQPDKDKDGIPDNLDKCPDKPENYNGFEDDDGCPDKGASLVQVGETEIKILERVEFATSKDKIEGAKSFAVLDAVVGAMKGHPEIFQIEVAGHTDNAGNAADNRVLSQKRAEAVVTYLTSKGIDAVRLKAKGYGPDKPISENSNAAGKQKNRRVEFTILKSLKNPGASGSKPKP